MGVVTVSSAASRTPLDLRARFSTQRSTSNSPLILAFKTDKTKNTPSVKPPREPITLPIDTPKELQKPKRGGTKRSRAKAISVDEALSLAEDMDYNEVAAKLENIYKLSPTPGAPEVKVDDCVTKKGPRKRRGDMQLEKAGTDIVVRNRGRREKRLSLEQRIALCKSKEDSVVHSILKKSNVKDEDGKIENLVREYSTSIDMVSLDWKKMKIPPVLPSSEHAWLFKLMQPMKGLIRVKEEYLKKKLGREPRDGELAEATNRPLVQIRKDMEVGHAARNKLIKHNLRLILFTINKYFQEFSSGPRFQDLCQAGVKGLILAVDRFEPNRRSRLSTYSLFWIRHAITRSLTVSSFLRVPFGLESIRLEIQKAKQELSLELQRSPTETEIIERIGISPERYHEVMKASKPVLSLHSRHPITQEESINGIADTDGVGDDMLKQPTLLRFALDDVLDSLKPKESLVIRQRYGLDGKGCRTLGEIAGNLNISREMVRKHEMKALMKLKHPARVDYLRSYVSRDE